MSETNNSTTTTQTEKETIMTEMTTTTITLTQDQLAKLTYLAKTGMNGQPSKHGERSLQEITYQAIERGIASIEQTRKQYARTREAVKAFKK